MTDAANQQLRERVRALVIEALSRVQEAKAGTFPVAPPSTDLRKKLLVVFMSPQETPAEFFAQAEVLVRQQYVLETVFSRTFSAFHKPAEMLKQMPAETRVLDSGDEVLLSRHLQAAEAVVAPVLSRNTASKVASGISDSAPSIIMCGALALGKPVFVSQDALNTGSPDSISSVGLARVLENHIHALQHMGIRFVPVAELADSVLTEFAPVVNLTPERLAKTRPATKREFVVEEDIWNAISRGEKELTYSRAAVVTDAARELATRRGFVLKSD